MPHEAVGSSANQRRIEAENKWKEVIHIIRGQRTKCLRRTRRLDGPLRLEIERVHTGLGEKPKLADRSIAPDDEEHLRAQCARIARIEADCDLPDDVVEIRAVGELDAFDLHVGDVGSRTACWSASRLRKRLVLRRGFCRDCRRGGWCWLSRRGLRLRGR